MVPTCVSPNVSPCASWTTDNTATEGSCAVISQRATALSAADHHQQRRRQREARRQREHHDLGEHAQHPQSGNGQPAKTRACQVMEAKA